MNKSKEQFEKWLKSTGQKPPYAVKRGYWEIWQASREALNVCPKCGGTGMADSGGVQPWGEPIEIECDCQFEEQDNDTN